jgi:hypothetical protein
MRECKLDFAAICPIENGVLCTASPPSRGKYRALLYERLLRQGLTGSDKRITSPCIANHGIGANHCFGITTLEKIISFLCASRDNQTAAAQARASRGD